MIVGSIKRLWQHFKDDNLFRNSIYMMLTTGTMGGFGFFFWIICTHLFTPDQIGVGTSLISAMSLVSFISLLGFNNTFVRFLPNSADRDSEINTGSIVVMVASVVISIVYLVLLPHFTPGLIILRSSFWYMAGFVVMVSLASINSLTDSIFIAYRSAQYMLITDGLILSITKLLLPALFIGFGAYGVFASAGLATTVGMIASVAYLIYKFGYKPQIKIDVQNLKKVFHYSFANYISNLFNILPTLALPIIVINHLGAPAAGYYFLTFMIINLLYSVSSSISQSLFAEGSYSTTTLRALLKSSFKILIIIMLPAVALLVILGPYILQFFGKSYSDGGSQVLVILALTAPAVAAYNFGSVLLRIRHQIYSLMAMNGVYAATILGLTVLWIGRGLVWVSIAWLIGNIVAAALSFVLIYVKRQNPTPNNIPMNY